MDESHKAEVRAIIDQFDPLKVSIQDLAEAVFNAGQRAATKPPTPPPDWKDEIAWRSFRITDRMLGGTTSGNCYWWPMRECDAEARLTIIKARRVMLEELGFFDLLAAAEAQATDTMDYPPFANLAEYIKARDAAIARARGRSTP